MKPFLCLAAAALLTPLAASLPSHAAFMPWRDATTYAAPADSNDPALILVNGPRTGGANRNVNVNRNANRQGFNSNNFHNSVSNNHNVNVNRNANVNVNRNANVNVNRNAVVHGGGCCASYDSGPGWGGVAAGVAVGAVVGAAAASAAQPPPPYYPPGSVYVPAY
jgi:hypothetical protein